MRVYLEVHLPAELLTPRLTITRARALLAGYWVLLAIGSHWPRLSLFPQAEKEAVFQVDKSLHVLAFAGLAWLMIRAKIAGRRATPAWTATAVGGLALFYAGVDEWTQHWAQRQVSLSDVTASAIGVLAVVLVGSMSRRSTLPTAAVWTARLLWLLTAVSILVLALPPSGNRLTHRLLALFTPTWGGIDKPCHFFAAIVMTWLLAAAYPAGVRRPRCGAFVTILVMGLSAPMIELAQAFTGRGVEAADIFAHELGFLVALLVWTLVSIGRALLADGFTERYE